MGFLGLLDDEVFVVLDIILEFVQSFDDLWFVFLDLGLDECTSLILGVVESSFDLGPDSFQVSDDFNSLSLSTDEDFLGSLDHNFFESIDISLSFLKAAKIFGFKTSNFSSK